MVTNHQISCGGDCSAILPVSTICMQNGGLVRGYCCLVSKLESTNSEALKSGASSRARFDLVDWGIVDFALILDFSTQRI